MLLLTLKVFPQPGTWHFHGFSPVWEYVCIFKELGLEKALLHVPQMYRS